MGINIRPVDRAYIAGFFDGEGCIRIRPQDQRVVVAIGQKDPTTLYWIQQLIGCGHVRFNRGASEAGVWYLNIGDRHEVLHFIQVVYKHSQLKRRQLAKARRHIEAQLAR